MGNGTLATIREIYQENVAKSGAPEEYKWVLAFNELEKPMVLNSVNGQIIAQITGSEDSDGWIGAQIELYNDPSIMFAGRLTGGIRVCAPGARPQASMQRPQRQMQRPTMHQQQRPQGQPMHGQPMQGQGGVRQARPYQPPQSYNPQQQAMEMPPDVPTDDDGPY